MEATLEGWSYEVRIATDGQAAWSAIAEPDGPRLLILDWMMPGIDGPELCRRARGRPDGGSFYILLLTAKTGKADIVAGLEAGADDYVTKPFDREELRARVQTGRRIVELHRSLAARVSELEAALTEVKRLSGLLPMCAYCKRIRESQDYWQQVEAYLASHSEAQFSHGVCPECYDKHVKPQLEGL